MASGMAKGARARGKRIAFGDGYRIVWGPWSEAIFRHNPNIARPGEDHAQNLEWIAHYKGHRLYNKSDGRRWTWNETFRPIPGEVFFGPAELEFGRSFGRDFILIEPNVPDHKTTSHNKDWGKHRYQAVADQLRNEGRRVLQFSFGSHRLFGLGVITAPDFRKALAVLANAALYIGPEGGLHHGAAAVGIPAVVLFGGFIPPSVTGYDTHANLTGGAEACGSLGRCRHCRLAMDAISIDKVLKCAHRFLDKRNQAFEAASG